MCGVTLPLLLAHIGLRKAGMIISFQRSSALWEIGSSVLLRGQWDMAQHMRWAVRKLERGVWWEQVETVATTLSLAEQNHAEELKRVCLEFVSRNLQAVMLSEGYQHMVTSCPQLQVTRSNPSIDDPLSEHLEPSYTDFPPCACLCHNSEAKCPQYLQKLSSWMSWIS